MRKEPRRAKTMSKVSASTTLTLVPDLGTFNLCLLCNKGDLWQYYEGPASAPTKVTPDFPTAQPIVSLYVTSSRVAGTEIPDEVKFYLGDVLVGTITKVGTSYTKTLNSDAAYSGMFELLDPTQNSGSYGLKIKKNLVGVTAGLSTQIRAVAMISSGTSSAELQAACPVTISEVTENSSICVIEAGDNYNFQITKANTSVKLTARFFRGLTEVTTGISYKWYKQVFNPNAAANDPLAHWQLIASATGPTLTVTEADVDTSQRYMVRILDSTGTTVLGQDTQMVYDNSDLYEILISRSPEDGQVHKAGDSVTVTCAVVRRGNSTTEILPATAKWTFNGTSPAGLPIISQGPTTSNQCTVSYSHVEAAGGQLELTATVEF